MHEVYVLRSPSTNRYYIGESVNAANRLLEHNQGHYTGSSTSFANDWELILLFKVTDRKAALVVEKHLKSMKSKIYLQKLSNDTLALEKFKSIVEEKYQIRIV